MRVTDWGKMIADTNAEAAMAGDGAVRGRFVWYELLTSDPDGAKRFYPGVTGWGTQDWEGGEEPYTMWTTGGMPVGGVMRLPDEAKAQGAPSNWLPYIGTPDADATHRQALELGAKSYVEPTDIPTVGRFAVLGDPQGAVFAIYSPAEEPPASEPGPGRFSWNELITTDHTAAFDFYSKLFGWEKTSEFDMGEMGIYQLYGQHGIPYGGMFNKPPEMPAPPHWLCYVMVPDVNEGIEAVKKAGGQILNGPMEVPGGDLIAQCMDGSGAVFALHQKAAQS